MLRKTLADRACTRIFELVAHIIQEGGLSYQSLLPGTHIRVFWAQKKGRTNSAAVQLYPVLYETGVSSCAE